MKEVRWEREFGRWAEQRGNRGRRKGMYRKIDEGDEKNVRGGWVEEKGRYILLKAIRDTARSSMSMVEGDDGLESGESNICRPTRQEQLEVLS